MHIDKKNARNGGRRISEASLITVAAIGGSFGVFIGMMANRHKTKKPLFYIGVPLLMAIHIGLMLYLA